MFFNLESKDESRWKRSPHCGVLLSMRSSLSVISVSIKTTESFNNVLVFSLVGLFYWVCKRLTALNEKKIQRFTFDFFSFTTFTNEQVIISEIKHSRLSSFCGGTTDSCLSKKCTGLIRLSLLNQQKKLQS